MAHGPPPPAIPRRNDFALWIILLVLVAIALGLLVWKPLGTRPNLGKNHPAVGKPFPAELTFVPLTGKGPLIQHDDLAGRVTLINFWGTWCPPCRMEFPHLIEMERERRDQPDFMMVPVSCGFGSDDTDLESLFRGTAWYLRRRAPDLKTYADPGAITRLALTLQLGFESSYPTTYVLDRRGIVRGTWTGFRTGDERDMAQLIDDLLVE